jgi:hypothetical protein
MKNQGRQFSLRWLKQIDPELKSLNVEDAASLEKALAELKGA